MLKFRGKNGDKHSGTLNLCASTPTWNYQLALVGSHLPAPLFSHSRLLLLTPYHSGVPLFQWSLSSLKTMVIFHLLLYHSQDLMK